MIRSHRKRETLGLNLALNGNFHHIKAPQLQILIQWVGCKPLISAKLIDFPMAYYKGTLSFQICRS